MSFIWIYLTKNDQPTVHYPAYYLGSSQINGYEVLICINIILLHEKQEPVEYNEEHATAKAIQEIIQLYSLKVFIKTFDRRIPQLTNQNKVFWSTIK